jgi:hypothetical protein
LTNRPADTPAQALEEIQWYLCRWQIEAYFRILKRGCRIEKLQLEKREHLEPITLERAVHLEGHE